jgi:hypothetical protein
VESFSVCKYFDDHLDSAVKSNLSHEEAIKLRNSLTPGCYISYEMRPDPVKFNNGD